MGREGGGEGFYCHPSTHCVVRPAWTVGKQRFSKIYVLESHKLPRKEIIRIGNCNNITVML